MGRQRRWRYLAAQRSGRVRLAVTCAVIGLLVLALATASTLWQRQIRRAAGTLVLELAHLGFLPLPVLLGGFLLVAALVIYLMPLPRTHSYLAANPQRIPRIAVYLDSENQLPNSAIEPFLAYLHSFVGGRRAELVLFSDAAITANGKKYRSLVKGGFRPVDVPHKRMVDVDGDAHNAKNAVDVELSLYAYQQAMLSPHPMDIVLVAGDHDYVPLIRRLWVEGHHVHVWAMNIPTSIEELAHELNVKTARFSSLFSWEATAGSHRKGTTNDYQDGPNARSTQDKAPGAGRLRPPSQTQKPSDSTTPTQAAGNVTLVDREQVVSALAYNREALDRISEALGTGKRARKVLSAQVGNNHHRSVIEAFGFTGKGWTARWFVFLQALELFAPRSGGGMPLAGPLKAESAADHLMQFLHELSDSAYTLAASTPDRTVSYASLRNQLVAAPEAQTATAALRNLIANPSPEWPSPLAQLCRAAAAVGIMRSEQLPGNAAIRLLDRGVGEEMPMVPNLSTEMPLSNLDFPQS